MSAAAPPPNSEESVPLSVVGQITLTDRLAIVEEENASLKKDNDRLRERAAAAEALNREHVRERRAMTMFMGDLATCTKARERKDMFDRRDTHLLQIMDSLSSTNPEDAPPPSSGRRRTPDDDDDDTRRRRTLETPPRGRQKKKKKKHRRAPGRDLEALEAYLAMTEGPPQPAAPPPPRPAPFRPPPPPPFRPPPPPPASSAGRSSDEDMEGPADVAACQSLDEEDRPPPLSSACTICYETGECTICYDDGVKLATVTCCGNKACASCLGKLKERDWKCYWCREHVPERVLRAILNGDKRIWPPPRPKSAARKTDEQRRVAPPRERAAPPRERVARPRECAASPPPRRESRVRRIESEDDDDDRATAVAASQLALVADPRQPPSRRRGPPRTRRRIASADDEELKAAFAASLKSLEADEQRREAGGAATPAPEADLNDMRGVLGTDNDDDDDDDENQWGRSRDQDEDEVESDSEEEEEEKEQLAAPTRGADALSSAVP